VTTTPTVASALSGARSLGIDRLDAQVLLAAVLARPRTWLLAHDDAALDAGQRARWDALIRRRARGEPLAYLVGEKEFHGIVLEVDARVLVPRPETELLVERALEILRDGRARRVVDLGTGSGAIALAVKAACPAATVLASDASEAALDVARANGRRLALEVGFRLGSWWDAWPGERFDLALANPPYIPVGDPHLVALKHEPVGALVGGEDGLAALASIVAGAAARLQPRGWLWLEHGHDQADRVRGFLGAARFEGIETLVDLNGLPRCTGGWCRDPPNLAALPDPVGTGMT